MKRAETMVRWVGAVALGLLAGSGPATEAQRPVQRPNFLFVLTDDLDTEYPDGTWIDHFPALKAAMALNGTEFKNHFVTVSLCCPSRTTILRGQYSHNTQIFTNNPPGGGFQKVHDLGLEDSTIATWLHDAGYRTALYGKYLNGYPGKMGDGYIPPGWDEWHAGEKGAYGQFNYDLNENGKLVHYGAKPEEYLQDVIHKEAADFIRRMAASGTGQPFFIYMATYSPHQPAAFAPRYADRFPSAKAPRPPTFNEKDVSQHPQWVRNRRLLTPKEIEGIDDLYRRRLRSMLVVEETVVDLIEVLRSTGQLENTYIVFTSDNGFHLGQHRLASGKNTEFEEDLHVPLLVRGPGIAAGKVVSRMTLNMDLAPTFADFAAVKTPDFVDGRSLRALLAGDPDKAAWRVAFLLEHGYMGDDGRTPADLTGLLEPADAFDYSAKLPPPFKGAHTERYVFAAYPSTRETELYDLRHDPYEHRSLAPVTDPEVLKKYLVFVDKLDQCKGAACRALEDAGPEGE